MSNLLIAFLVAVGFSAWVYNKTMHSTGNNTKTALIVAFVAGTISLLLVTTLLGFIPEN